MSDIENYISKQAALWLANILPPPPEGNIYDSHWRTELGIRLGTLPAVHNLIRQSNNTCSLNDLLERFSRQLGLGEQYPFTYRVLLLESLLALISHARRSTRLINGKVVFVSADRTSTKNEEEDYYLVKIETNETSFTKQNENFRLYSGVPVVVGVITGKRSFIDYFLIRI